jgi:hypothetical protein
VAAVIITVRGAGELRENEPSVPDHPEPGQPEPGQPEPVTGLVDTC